MSKRPIEYRHTYTAWAEVFTIFARYAGPETFAEVAAAHDEIYAGVDAEQMSAEDRTALGERAGGGDQ